MFRRFAYSLGGILPHRLSSEMKELYWATVLQNLALAMLLLFEPIYLWQQHLSLRGIVLFFLAVYLTYFFILPLGAKFACRYGYEHSMAFATLMQVAYYVCLFLVARSYLFLAPAVLLYALQKTFCWPAYHADFARYSDQTEEGRELSGLTVALSLVYVVGPLVAGLVLQFGTWALLFGLGSCVMLLSNWPLLKTREVFTPRAFSYSAAYTRLFARDNWRRLLGYMGFGEELIVLVLWPIYISLVVVAYLEVGAVVATSTLVMGLVTLYVGKLTDEHNKHEVLRLSTALYAFGWIARLLAHMPFSVFLVDAWSRLTKNVVAVPLTAITYERAKAHSVMDTVVSFEMSLVVGKLTACVALLVVLAFVPAPVTALSPAWVAAWLLASAMTLLYTFI